VTEAPKSRDVRTFGLLAATGVGVGAIVGGGILVLAGAAFSATGPSAILAFALNGSVAAITALSFAEMSTAFPESGGAYVFAKKILNVRAAFAVGWILWFAYIVGGVLYALGFAEYASEFAGDIWRALGAHPPGWLTGHGAVIAFALGASGLYTLSLARKSSGGGQWPTVGKVVVFAVLLAAGFWAVATRKGDPIAKDLIPFFPHGATGLVKAMGMTFIALQGFELVAAIAGEVRDPRRTIPRAMFLSLGAALLVYLPLLFITTTAGTPPGTRILAMSEAHTETVMAIAVREFMGPTGYVLVMIAAILSTLSALHACLLAASRVAFTMAVDRTLPRVLAQRHATRKTPLMALYATLLAVAAILFMVPDLAAAGAAAGLIFLVSFGLAHWTAFLARRRGGAAPGAFKTPLFPLVPVLGIASCGALAIFQAVAVPAAGAISGVWLGLGVILYFAIFASRAEIVDAVAEAHDPHLVRLRGRTPVVLVPVANPENAAGLVDVASALAPPAVGRVVLLSVMRRPEVVGDVVPDALKAAQRVIGDAMTRALGSGHQPEALITIADAPWDEIMRLARSRQCECILLGLTKLSEAQTLDHLESLLNKVECDVAVLNAPRGFRLDRAKRVLVPVGGRGSQHELRARLLGSLGRTAPREITFMRVLEAETPTQELEDTKLRLRALAEEETRGHPQIEVVASPNPSATVLERASQNDLLVLGLPRVGGRKLFGEFAVKLAQGAPCATIMLSQGG
jgi:basic amino acid/polyamine antiporter, APA family